jgi:hypothetical protein
MKAALSSICFQIRIPQSEIRNDVDKAGGRVYYSATPDSEVEVKV